MMNNDFELDAQKIKFEKTKRYLLKHPWSGSAWHELGYKYYHKGLFCEEIKELLFFDDVMIVRGAAAILAEFGCPCEWRDDLLQVYNACCDGDTKLYLETCLSYT